MTHRSALWLCDFKAPYKAMQSTPIKVKHLDVA